MRRNEQLDLGTVAISIELELAIDRPSLERQHRLDHLTAALLDLFAKHRLPATWGLADPAHSAATPSILAGGVGHEIAVLGERSWMGPGAGGLRIQRELSRRFEGARSNGVSAGTLVVRDVSEPIDLELLLAHKITAISYSSPAGPTQPAIGALRYGVWHAPAAWRFPIAPSWWRPISWLTSWRLRETMSQRRLLHVAVDGDALVDHENDGLEQVRTIITQVARLSAAGKLAVRTLGALAAENLAHRSAQPTRSLLAPAA